MKPLDGIRVLDLTKVLAGPLCAQYLGDLGAEVIKVESPKGDDTRHWPPFHTDANGGEKTGTVFLSVNRNKKSLGLDLKSDEGRAVLRRLARTADVLIESNATGVVERLGIDYASLCAENPRLVYCSISGFGRSGPLKDNKGYDLIVQAFTGVMAMTGEPGGSPVRVPLSPIDQATGLNAQSGILAALYQREKTGRGAFLEVSLFETAIALLGFNLQRSWTRGTAPAKSGTGHESLCPYRVFNASDGDVLIGVANDSLWRKFCDAVGRPELTDDERFSTNAERVRHADQTNRIVEEIVSQRSIDEWVARLTELGVPCVPLNDALQAADHPQTKARELVQKYVHPRLGPLKGVANPVLFAGIPRDVGTRPPGLGEDSRAVLEGLGLSGTEIDRLIATRVVIA